VRFVLLTVSARQPRWVEEGYVEYARRLRPPVSLELKEIPLAPRTRGVSVARAVEQEGERMLAALPRGAHIVALDERGDPWRTADLAARLERWRTEGKPVALLVGGPDGLAPSCRERADETWSLSPLTLPHGLVRIVVAEALYRAVSWLEGHPYHRA